MTGSGVVQNLNRGRTQRTPHFASGNGACLVIVDSGGSYWHRSIVQETILVALEHFGMPYRLLDLASERPQAETLNTCAAILLAQNGLGGSLSEDESRAIAEAVNGGVGLVNFDYDVRRCPGRILEIFGFDPIEDDVYATNQVRIGHEPHWITAMQDPDECHLLDRMVSAVRVKRWRHDVKVLARAVLSKEQLVYSRHLVPGAAMEPGNHPILFAATRGQGRAVQFTINMRAWLGSVYGHGREMDDLFWRAIVWAARKPFSANMVPPFVCLSVDDCDGRTDLEYAKIAARHGFVPLVSLNIHNVSEDLFPTIRELVHSGKALCNTHTLDYYELLSYNFGKGECSHAELDLRFGLHDTFWKDVGVEPSRTFRGHWGEYGVNGLPYLKKRGITLLNPAHAMGLLKMDQLAGEGYWPYGRMNRMYDWMPDDPDFVGFSSFPPRGQEDFLVGCFPIRGEAIASDAEKAGRSGARVITTGLRSRFFGELVTHEQSFDVVSLSAWERTLRRTVELTQRHETVFADHDQIGHYLKAKLGTSIAGAHVEGGSFCVQIVGQAATPLRLSVFHNEHEGVRPEYREVEPFEGESDWKERL